MPSTAQKLTQPRDLTTALIVEDDPWSRSLMAELLVEERYEVLQANSGEAGLKLAAEHRPDVILLDLGLPTMSGLEVLRELKAEDRTRDIPVVVVSAYTVHMGESDTDQAEALVQKPFEVASLLRTVAQASRAERAVLI
jgi:two-component system, cell cycle response regulator DivK